MNRYFGLFSLALILLTVCEELRAAGPGTITAHGAVTAMTSTSQFNTILGAADFGSNHSLYAPVPKNAYASMGMLLHGANGFDDGIEDDAVSLSSIVPGVTSYGYAILPSYYHATGLFSGPIGGGGTQLGDYAVYSFTGSFTVPVNQFGLTLSKNGNQYITAWGADGAMLGQVDWRPDGTASFVGMYSPTPIKLVTVGNDDMFAGAVFEVQGLTTTFDTVIWAVPEPSTLLLLAIGAVGLLSARRTRQ